MIDKATFEAHVRAEAMKKHPNPSIDNDGESWFELVLENRERDRKVYIAARMEHEWPLVEALEDIATNFDHDSDAHKYGTSCRKCVAAAALSPYTKPNQPTND